MKISYTFTNATFTDMVKVAYETEQNTGLTPFYLEDNEVIYNYESDDAKLLLEGTITEEEYKTENKL